MSKLADTLIDIVTMSPEAAEKAAGIMKSQREIDRLEAASETAITAELERIRAERDDYKIRLLILKQCRDWGWHFDCILDVLAPYCILTGDELSIVVDGQWIDFETALDWMAAGKL